MFLALRLISLLTPAFAALPWSVDAPLPVAEPATSPDVAVVVGLEIYQNTKVSKVLYAKRDADAVTAYLTSTQGLDPAAITRVENPTRGTYLAALAAAREAAKLRKGRVWVYFAGHGWRKVVADPKAPVEQVLVMYDTTPTTDGYVSAGVTEGEVWRTLGDVPAEVIVDVCFDGSGRDAPLVDPGSRFMLIDYSAQPPPSGVSVWRAASPGQEALPLRDAEHGLFTFLWLAGARGWADGGTGGDRDGVVTAGELYGWIQRVTQADEDPPQTPMWSGNGGLVVARATAKLKLDPGPAIEELQAWLPFLSRRNTTEGWLAWREAQNTWFGAQTAVLQKKAKDTWARVKAYEASGAPDGGDGVLGYIQQYRGASLSREGEYRQVYVPELIDAWLALRPLDQRPKDTGVPGYGDEVTLVPGGWFWMGSPRPEVGRGTDEVQHRVEVGTFVMGQFEVSQALFGRYWAAKYTGDMVPSVPYEKDHSGVSLVDDAFPAQNVSWCDAVGFANWLTGEWNRTQGATLTLAYTGAEQCTSTSGSSVKPVPGATGWRLPTEAEWEYAARAGGTGVYGATSEGAAVCGYGNVQDAQAKAKFGWDGFPCDDKAAGLAKVGSYRPNAWGLYDTLGNVWEWTGDWYGDYPTGLGRDGGGPLNGEYRVVRGGSWYTDPSRVRVADRRRSAPGHRWNCLGLRLARSSP